jgi:hypothetical protein
MATNFPTSKQTFTDPSSGDALSSPSHSGLHTDMNDTVEAIQDKVGITSSAPAANKFLMGDGANSSQWNIDFKDEDNMASDSATAIPSQQSVKAYADTMLPKAGGTMTGDIQLGETDIKLDAELSGDEKWSGIVIAGVAGATLAVGDLVYLNADDSRWELVDANLSDGYDKQLGICVLAGNDGDGTELLVYGKVRSAAFPAFTVGSPLYMSETAGDVTHTAPTTTDVCVRKVGIAITAEDMLFNPSNDYYTHT